jgi:hypothetical protein
VAARWLISSLMALSQILVRTFREFCERTKRTSMAAVGYVAQRTAGRPDTGLILAPPSGSFKISLRRI